MPNVRGMNTGIKVLAFFVVLIGLMVGGNVVLGEARTALSTAIDEVGQPGEFGPAADLEWVRVRDRSGLSFELPEKVAPTRQAAGGAKARQYSYSQRGMEISTAVISTRKEPAAAAAEEKLATELEEKIVEVVTEPIPIAFPSGSKTSPVPEII